MTLLKRLKGWFKSEGVTVEIDLAKERYEKDRLTIPYFDRIDSVSKMMNRSGKRLTYYNGEWGSESLPPKPSHVDNYLSSYGANRWVG